MRDRGLNDFAPCGENRRGKYRQGVYLFENLEISTFLIDFIKGG